MWQPSATISALSPGRIDVWRLPLADESIPWSDVLVHLSAEEQHRAASFHLPLDQRRFARTRGVLRDLLGRYCDLPPAQIEFEYTPKGKPQLTGAAASSGVQFNVSHSGDLALIALACEAQVGVDVERLRSGVAGIEIARRYFSTREVDDLIALPDQEREAAFFRCWTRKEAFVKGTGLGVSFGLSSFSVSHRPGDQQALVAPPSTLKTVWRIHDLPLGEGYAGALAHELQDARMSLMAWPPRQSP